MEVTFLQKQAISFAAQIYICIDGEITNDAAYEAYLKLCDCVENGQDLNTNDGISIWEPFEHWPLKQVVMNIYSVAFTLHAEYKNIFNIVKAGIIDQAINDKLDSDMNVLDMEGMFDIGTRLNHRN